MHDATQNKQMNRSVLRQKREKNKKKQEKH